MAATIQAQATAQAYSVAGVHKSYPAVHALTDVSMDVDKGESVCLIGPSGSGKTTLLHMLAGVVLPDCGSVRIEGRDIADVRRGRELSQIVGVIHQQFDLVPHLSVVHNVLAGRLGQWSLFRSLVSLVSPRERHLAESALARVGLSEKLYERTSRLSGGEQQRVAIARILVQNPRVIVADEPVSSLDPARAQDVLALLTGIAREDGKTLIASVHSTDLATRYFGRVVGLRNGSVQFDLPARSVTGDMLDSLYDLEGLGSESVAS